MKKLQLALFGASMLMMPVVMTSCDDDDTDKLSNRVTVVEGLITQMQSQLERCLTTGSTVTSASQDANGVWTLVLSDGQSITITPSQGGNSGGTGGSSVAVQENDNNIIVTIDGKEYILPKGASGVSLVYSPEYVDGEVHLGNTPAEVRFLCNPMLSQAQVDGAVFDIAEAHALKSRAGSDLMVVTGARVDGDHIVVTIKGLGVEGGGVYAAAVTATVDGGTTLTSNYFTVRVNDDYSFVSEEIGDFTIKADYAPTAVDADGFCSMTVDGLTLLGNVDFKTFFDQLPENASFQIGSANDQPNADARDKRSFLVQSLNSDGTFKFVSAPRTSFNTVGEEDKCSGFLIKIVNADYVTKAKIYVNIMDPLADENINWFPGYDNSFEVEYMSRTGYLSPGENTVDLPYLFDLDNDQVAMTGGADTNTTDADHILNFVMGNGDEFFEAYTNLVVTTADGQNEILKKVFGKGIEPTDYAKQFMLPDNEGVRWYNRGCNVQLNDGEGTIADYKYIFPDGTEFAQPDYPAIDLWWWGHDNSGKNMYLDLNGAGRPEIVKWLGLTVDADGKLHTGANYTGCCIRTAIGAYFDYAYGTKRLSKEDQFMLLYFNRRRLPENVTWPDNNFEHNEKK